MLKRSVIWAHSIIRPKLKIASFFCMVTAQKPQFIPRAPTPKISFLLPYALWIALLIVVRYLQTLSNHSHVDKFSCDKPGLQFYACKSLRSQGLMVLSVPPGVEWVVKIDGEQEGIKIERDWKYSWVWKRCVRWRRRIAAGGWIKEGHFSKPDHRFIIKPPSLFPPSYENLLQVVEAFRGEDIVCLSLMYHHHEVDPTECVQERALNNILFSQPI